MLADEVQALADELRSAQVRRGGPRGRRPASPDARARPPPWPCRSNARPRAGRHMGGARAAAEGTAPPARSARGRQQRRRSGRARVTGGRRRGAGQGGRGAAGGGAAGGRECAAGRPPGPAGERARRRAGAAPRRPACPRGWSACWPHVQVRRGRGPPAGPARAAGACLGTAGARRDAPRRRKVHRRTGARAAWT